MNSKIIQFLKNLSYSLTSNLVSLTVSLLVILIIPKLIGVEEYGYWQLYLFYVAYVGFLHFGWNDGIYLRYGGVDYRELDKGLFFSQFYMLALLQIFIALILSATAYFFVIDSDRTFILIMVALSLVIVNIRWMLIYTLQAANRIKEYALITIIGRILYIFIIITCLSIGFRDYKLMIIADIAGKVFSLSYALYACRDIVFRKISSFYFNFKETFENISVGIKLMFATIASMLIIGVVRFGIERVWDVSTFGKVSLTLSASNLIMIFINAVGVIIFPILRRTNKKHLPGIYTTMRDLLMVILLGVLMVYYPLKEVLSSWLPRYSDSLVYMALLFPICVYEGKMALLINTYLKTLRKESLMLKINIISLVISILSTMVFTILIKDLNLLVASIVILLAFRSILAEVYLSRILKIPILKDTFLEVFMTIVFVLSGWFVDSWNTILIYGTAYVAYLLLKRKDILKSAYRIRDLSKA